MTIFSQPNAKIFVLHDLSDGKFVFAKLISLKEFDFMVANNKIAKYEGLNKKINCEPFTTVKNEFLLRFEKEILLFTNKKDFNSVIEYGYYSKVISQTVMYGKNKVGEKFIDNVNILISELLTVLKINDNPKIDIELVKRVEKMISTLDNPFYFYREYFCNCLALIGEVFIANIKTLNWKVEIDDDGVTWNPFLMNKDRELNLFLNLYENIFVSYNINSPLLDIYNLYF